MGARPGGRSGARPGGRSGARPGGQSGARPGGRSGARPAARPARAPRVRGPLDSAGVDRLLERQPWDSLVPHLLKAGARAEPSVQSLKTYAKLLLEWNRGVSNLISRNDEHRIVERHIAESVEPAAWLNASGAKRWLDFGSGAGLPAIPLAIAGVGAKWTLVESRRMKTLFIRRALIELGLRHIEVVNGRLEKISEESLKSEEFDGFTSRATLNLGPTLLIAKRFVKPGGVAFLWKGSGREREMASDQSWLDSWEFDGLIGIGSGLTVVTRFTRKTIS